MFGPASAWQKLYWRALPKDVPEDKQSIQVIGVRQNGLEVLLADVVERYQDSLDLSSYNSSTYPYLKLRWRTEDSKLATPAQLLSWFLSCIPVPEGAISPNLFSQTPDTVEQGQPYGFKVAFKNVSNFGFDSLLIKLLVRDANNIQHVIPIPKTRTLLAGDTLQVGGFINTAALPGNNVVSMEVNPDSNQPEQYHFNNNAIRSFYAKPDSIDPTLDVTFDGVHILNQDIVSTRPNIRMQLNDNSRWMLLNDTSLMTVQVRYPNGQLRRFYFQNDTLQFFPAGNAPAQTNQAEIHFLPNFPLDGEYELIVSAKDRSQNVAGVIGYKVRFQIVNAPTITNLLNYPNPFTTRTAFLFTVTGNAPPSQFKIEILTVTGRVVREVTQSEIGPLRVGRNITSFRWDGTDQFGQSLANGIYLYRVVTRLNGKSLEVNKNPSTDNYFSRGYGKMYLMR
jgi:hypothetical protein